MNCNTSLITLVKEDPEFGVILAGMVMCGVLMLGSVVKDNLRAADRSFPASVVRAFQVELADGGTVTCVAYKSGAHGGLSCDWEHIKP